MIRQLKVATRFKIVGVEVVGLGAFLLLILLLELRSVHSTSGIIQGFGWDYGIVGTTLILVGLEILSLIKNLPSGSPRKMENEDLVGNSTG
jgi:hypothetical protein